jgi:hypothetical protein
MLAAWWEGKLCMQLFHPKQPRISQMARIKIDNCCAARRFARPLNHLLSHPRDPNNPRFNLW